MSFEYYDYQEFFREVFSDYPSSILYHKSGISLHLMYERITEIGTLQSACNEIPKYFPMNQGDIVLFNDPYIGGGVLSNFSLLMGCSLNAKTPKAEAKFLLGIKFSIRPSLHQEEHLDKEGLKIPPTPIAEAGKINRDILDIICSHPDMDPSFRQHLEKSLDRLFQLEERILKNTELWNISWEQKKLEKYIDFCNQKMTDLLSRFKNKKISYKEQWVTEESLAMQVEKNHNKISVEFQDVGSSKLYHLTQAAVFGSCFASLLNFLEVEIPLNSGSLDCLDIKIPSQNFLCAQYPDPVFLGFTEGAGLIANMFSKVLIKLSKASAFAEGNIGICNLDVRFADGSHFYDRLPSGQGATDSENGSHCIDKWTHIYLQASVEDIEKRFPVRVRSTALRLGSGGNGSYMGGDGMIRSYQFLQNAKVQWFAATTGFTADGYQGGSSGLSPQFLLIRNNKRTKLELQGSLELEAGDRLDILSAGGGGLGDSYE